MREKAEYIAAWLFLRLLRLLPRPVACWTATRMAALFFGLRPSLRRAADINLQIVFPHLAPTERERLIGSMMGNIGRMAVEFAYFPTYTRENIERAIVPDEMENFAKAERRGKGVLFLTGHMGAWELAAFAHGLFTTPLHFLVRPIDNPKVNTLIKRYRCFGGNEPVPKNESVRAVLRVLRQGGVVAVSADQNTMPEEAIFVDFFGVPAATTTGIARLARQTGAAVMPVYSFWDASLGKYRLHYEPELALAHTDDEQADVCRNTELFSQAVERYVRRFPDQWLWIHKRWKTRPPGEAPIYPD
jgi:Kdo2-lipid IVA lauroyltransferase/acyltransferase